MQYPHHTTGHHTHPSGGDEKCIIFDVNKRKYAEVKSLKIFFSLPVESESNKFVT